MWAALIGLITSLFSLFINRKAPIISASEGLGEQTQKTADTQSALTTETAVANAEANAPITVAGVEDRMKEGSF